MGMPVRHAWHTLWEDRSRRARVSCFLDVYYTLKRCICRHVEYGLYY